MATFKPFKATDEFSMQTFNDKFEEVVADFNADNLKIDTALKALTKASAVVTGTYTGTGVAHTLELGFRPSLFIVWGEKVGNTTSNDKMCALCFDGGSPLYIRRDNSTVGSSSNSLTFTDDGVSLPAGWPNQATGSYFYAAFY